jgi:hypothetical protein
MRNLLQYPITDADKLAALDWALKAWEKSEAVGGAHGVALQEIRDEILARADVN